MAQPSFDEIGRSVVRSARKNPRSGRVVMGTGDYTEIHGPYGWDYDTLRTAMDDLGFNIDDFDEREQLGLMNVLEARGVSTNDDAFSLIREFVQDPGAFYEGQTRTRSAPPSGKDRLRFPGDPEAVNVHRWMREGDTARDKAERGRRARQRAAEPSRPVDRDGKGAAHHGPRFRGPDPDPDYIERHIRGMMGKGDRGYSR